MRRKLLLTVLALALALPGCGQSGDVKQAEPVSSSAEEVKSARVSEEEAVSAQEDASVKTGEEEGTGEETKEEEAPQEKSGDDYERGVLSDNGWESAFWQLRFTSPEGLGMMGEEELNSMMNLGEDFLSENFSEQQVQYAQMMNVYEMMSTNLSGDANVVVTTERLLASGFSAEDYLKATERTLTSVTTISYTVLEEGETFQIGEETYGVMKVMGEGNGRVIYQDFYARVKGNRALAIALTYTDDTAQMADEMIGAFEAF